MGRLQKESKRKARPHFLGVGQKGCCKWMLPLSSRPTLSLCRPWSKKEGCCNPLRPLKWFPTAGLFARTNGRSSRTTAACLQCEIQGQAHVGTGGIWGCNSCPHELPERLPTSCPFRKHLNHLFACLAAQRKHTDGQFGSRGDAFRKYDEDGSNSIDMSELQKVIKECPRHV